MTVLGRKQGLADQGEWQRAAAHARDLWPDDLLDNLVDRTVDEITRTVGRRHAALAWSGGKDSLALEHVGRLAGITEAGLAITELEYPEFLRWVTDNMPPGLTVLSTGQDLYWLRDHPPMLFPQGDYGPRWFTVVNHAGQTRYFQQARLDVLLTGRRRADGNWISNNGTREYRNQRGVVRYSPLADWPHEAVFALLQRERVTLPPCYGWPRGFQVGTGAWPARQWTTDTDHGFTEVWQIDPDVVREAATVLPQARAWLAKTGRT